MDKNDVTEAIITLAKTRREGSPISNEKIFRFVTKRQRYNRKAWKELTEILRQICNKTIHGYQFFPYNPMLASRYNFKINPNSSVQWSWCAGFQLFRRKS